MSDPHGDYRLDVHYPLKLFSQTFDRGIESIVGKESGSSGMGGSRDLNFYFDTSIERDQAAERIGSTLKTVSAVRRYDLDP